MPGRFLLEECEREHRIEDQRATRRAAPAGVSPRGTLLGDAKMANRWIGVALIAWCLAGTTTARAQMGPDGGGCPPQMVPGPLTPEQAPPGPPPSDCLSLPANIPNAFTEE